ncbi:MAG: hypothetical protein EHM41_05915 [Chloroflexi bacterium]|nr:MAG: hypothetical protein EHM41_05915 [Chloroflexota bacterium]
MERSISASRKLKRFAMHGWFGLGLIAVFWVLNWTLEGLRTHWGFFPLWLGYCLTVDALVYYRTGTSLLTRSWSKYLGLFIISAPVWWIYEAINVRLENWVYLGSESFDPLSYTFWATLNFTSVIPAVFGSVELITSFDFMKRIPRWLIIRLNNISAAALFAFGVVSLILMLIYPHILFPFAWISLYFILEPVNYWLGFRNMENWTSKGNWKPVIALWLGVLITAFFWEMWNFFAYPKWIYQIPWGDWFRIFEMPLLGYGGYLPFALELFALVNFVYGIFGKKNDDYVRVTPDP